MKKKSLIIQFFFIIIFITHTQVAYSDTEFQISGVVTTKDSFPIRRIKVEIIDGDHVLEHTDTNLLGYYRFNTKLIENTEYTLRLSGKNIQEKIIMFETLQTEISINTVVNKVPTSKIDSPENGFPLEEIYFSSSDSNDPDEDPLQFHWNFGDGVTSTENNPTHIYYNIGEYTITLQVIDIDGASDETTEKISILNRAPIAISNGPYTSRINSTVHLSSVGSYDPDGDPIEIHWDFGDGTNSMEANPEHIYSESKEYKIKLTVIDVHGEKDEEETKCFVVDNITPMAEANGPYQSYQGIQLQLSSEGTHDPDGQITSYYWEFENGKNSTEKSPKITIQEIGKYTVILTVSDNDGEENTDTTTIEIVEIENLAPIAEANGPYTGELNQYISFNSLGSYDPNNDTLEFIWNFGNGDTSNESYPRYQYSQTGTYTVTLTAIDPEQAINTDTTTCKIIKPSEPIIILPPPNQNPYSKITSPDEGETGQEITFNSSESYDPDGKISEYAWEFGDGANSNKKVPTHIYLTEGNYSVILTVTDNQGKKDKDNVLIIISNPNIDPILSLNKTYYAKTNEQIIFTPSECYDPDGEIIQYYWEFGDNTTSGTFSPTHNYAHPGNYNLTLTVVDDKSGEAKGHSNIHIVNNILPVGIIKSPHRSKIGELITFSALDSYDEDGEITQYLWDFNDGSFSHSSEINHTYHIEGEKNVRLLVIDDNQEEHEVYKKILVSENIPPEINVNETIQGQVYEKLTFISNSVDPDGKIVALLWEFGDGTSATGEKVYHSYDKPGVYYCKITATDDNYEDNSEAIEITIYEDSEIVFPLATVIVTIIFATVYLFKQSWLKLI